ncbi:MAG: asparagine synthase-related protein [Hydrogenophaga sp.]|uniref:asparagine synthase-related protein n=1 Tax=Hydrogenophaga sp. TaxID=1904254 RepID=UPI00272FC5A1|nr:asparagine synthase-related protein [Hydrogenophaga sp.]MDP2163236.1 asparagine synthase-related protein [Hydrogenophaga sp.]MDP3476333.1 asparagine synthase-related protein [Hydrogenophaga sp.]
MSGIAGIIHFDGRPVEPGQVEAMTAAMHYRGPDGINHWRRGHVALGQCMLRTTPESLEETQPLTNEDQSLVLVMDGRVDNWEELRRELLGKGAVLRTRADAELVLRAYEVWGEDCLHRIVGECVFFIWDARQQRLFAGRDAAGARHFYYHQGRGWFAFASEIKGLLALPQIERRLNESRLLDYLVPEFDRDDEVGTFYQDVLRLPAGHAMCVTAAGPRAWRWWNPDELTEQKFASLAECTEAFMDQLRVAVQCRLRSIKPVGAMLSGGLDSSSIVGLISKEFRGELREPLRTVSLIREDRNNCPDWRSIDAILQADPWLQPTIVTSAHVDAVWQDLLDSIETLDEPFALSHGLTYGITYEAARQAGCGVVLDGMAGDVLFYSPGRTVIELVRRHRYDRVPAALAAWRNHGLAGGPKEVLRAALANAMPDALRAWVRQRRDERQLGAGTLKALQPNVALPYLASKRTAAYMAGDRQQAANDQAAHARNFTGGLISFAHETYGPLALARGVEPRSPFSDRRMIEFAIRMPLAAKLAIPWYKQVLRSGSAGMLPTSVCWRSDIGSHPGWTFFDRLTRNIAEQAPAAWDTPTVATALEKWANPAEVHAGWSRFCQTGQYDAGVRAYGLLMLSRWMASRAGQSVG